MSRRVSFFLGPLTSNTPLPTPDILPDLFSICFSSLLELKLAQSVEDILLLFDRLEDPNSLTSDTLSALEKNKNIKERNKMQFMLSRGEQ